MRTNKRDAKRHEHGIRREDLRGTWGMQRQAELSGKKAKERNERAKLFGIERIMEYALEIAWKGAKAVWLSFDIDSVDPAFAPGTGTPEPGGLLPREVFKMLRLAAREGLQGMEVVEVLQTTPGHRPHG